MFGVAYECISRRANFAQPYATGLKTKGFILGGEGWGHNCVLEGRYTAISRKVVGRNVHATIPKGNMGYDQYTVPDN